MPAVGELVRCTDGSWMIRPPQRCPRGHRLGAGRTLVGHQPCDCGGGHTTWTCLACGGVVYAPPLTAACVSWLARPRCGNRGLSAGDRGRHRGADLVIINGVGDRYDALLAALAVAQVGGGAVEDGSGLAG